MLLLQVLLSLVLGSQFLWAQDSQESSVQMNAPKETDFTFNPVNVKRDPFGPPEVAEEVTTNELQLYDVAEMKLVAIMTGLGAPKAMFLLPNSRSHIIQEGDKLGRNGGRVVNIKPHEVVLVESFKDYRGRQKKNFVNISLEKN